MPLEATIGQLLALYCPGGRQGNRMPTTRKKPLCQKLMRKSKEKENVVGKEEKRDSKMQLLCFTNA
jgi:hypothetical protein